MKGALVVAVVVVTIETGSVRQSGMVGGVRPKMLQKNAAIAIRPVMIQTKMLFPMDMVFAPFLNVFLFAGRYALAT